MATLDHMKEMKRAALNRTMVAEARQDEEVAYSRAAREMGNLEPRRPVRHDEGLPNRPERLEVNYRAPMLLTTEQRAEIRRRHASGDGSYRSLAKEYKVAYLTISRIVRSQTGVA